jgi:hypothetical protein
MDLQEKIEFLEQRLKEARKVTYTFYINHKMAAEQQLAIEEELHVCQCQLQSKHT